MKIQEKLKAGRLLRELNEILGSQIIHVKAIEGDFKLLKKRMTKDQKVLLKGVEDYFKLVKDGLKSGERRIRLIKKLLGIKEIRKG